MVCLATECQVSSLDRYESAIDLNVFTCPCTCAIFRLCGKLEPRGACVFVDVAQDVVTVQPMLFISVLSAVKIHISADK